MLVGRVGHDPECKILENGTHRASLALATTSIYKNKTTGEKTTTTEWHNLLSWGAGAEIISKFVAKGMLLEIEGHLQTSKWIDRDGIKRTKTEVIVENFYMLSKVGSRENPPPPTESDEPPLSKSEIENQDQEDDLPF